jgi:hypothetical protein
MAHELDTGTTHVMLIHVLKAYRHFCEHFILYCYYSLGVLKKLCIDCTLCALIIYSNARIVAEPILHR